MSELTRPEWKTFSEYFLPKYNEINDTGFFYLDQDPKVFNSDWDFSDNDKNILSIQHTRAIGTDDDVKMEITRPKISEHFINGLKNELMIRGVKNCYISLNISNPPHTKDEARSASYWIAEWIRKRYFDSSRRKIYSFDQEEYDIYIKHCLKWVSEIDLFEDDGLRFGFGWSKYPLEVNGVLDSPERFANAVEKKDAKNYSNAEQLVLVVDFSPFAFNDNDLSKFKEAIKKAGTKFKAIWVYQLWSGARGAIEVYKS